MANNEPIPKVLVVQGAGMDLRGKTQVEIFGPETLDEINTLVRSNAEASGLAVEIFHDNDEGAVVARLQAAAGEPLAALLINPGGFTASAGGIPDAITRLPFPAYEIHASNPAARGVASLLLPVCKGAVCGFGYAGYKVALMAIREQLDRV